MQISSRITCVLNSSPNDVDFWVQVFCCNMTMLGPVLPVKLLQRCKICPSSVYHIRQTSLHVIFTPLDHSKRRWEAGLSGPTKRCGRLCTSGCTLWQRYFWCRIHLRFRWMGGLQAKSMTSQRNRAVTSWRICVTMATLWQQQDGGYVLLWKRYDKKYNKFSLWLYCWRCRNHL